MAKMVARAEVMKEITEALLNAESLYIFPHMVADGDSMGSCASFCRLMRNLGKTADIMMEDEIADNLKFLDKGYVTFVDENTEVPQRDLCVALDCSNTDRFPKRNKMFFSAGKKTICIDHHVTEFNYADINLIAPDAASNTELLYELYEFMGVEIDKEMAEAIYTGIVTDTGNFQYTNTTKKTHIITAELYDRGIDTKQLNITLFQSVRPQKLMLRNTILNTLEMRCDNRVSMAYVTLDMYDSCDAKTSESDGINATLRDIKGVEMAVFLREKQPGEIKVGFRSKDYVNVSEVCLSLGGGGHKHAAGCTIYGNMEEALEIIRKVVDDVMAEYDAKRA
ncbi:MAG: bifunctional oligoribonuclease/PAP phosphatase NrnA [Firmicutes bacterium]|nr:bifunctional oligoribonuclease/PAP phosphatase NrnA [Bacillota bacterium]